MAKRVVLSLIFMPLATLFAQWQAMGPPGGDFRALATAPGNSSIIYLASTNSPSNIWKTTNAGDSWTRAGSVNSYVYSLAVDPTNSDILYAGGTYMYRSTNGGSTWTQLTLPSSHWYMYDVEVHPTVPTVVMASCYVYAGSYYRMGFLKSTNSGTSWTSETLSVDTSYSYSLAVDRSNPNNVYVGGYRRMSGVYTPTVYKSTDGGNTFAATGAIPSGGYYVYSMAVHETNSNYVYAGTLYGVYRSTDGGGAWTRVSTYNYNYSLTTTPLNANLLYSGGSGVVLRSTDAGATWTAHNTGLAGSIFYGVAASRSSASTVFAVNNSDFFRSTNTGANWARADYGLNAAPVTAMANAPSEQSRLYVDSDGANQYRSTNNGATWTVMTKPLSCGSLCDFAVAYNSPNYVLEFEGSG